MLQLQQVMKNIIYLLLIYYVLINCIIQKINGLLQMCAIIIIRMTLITDYTSLRSVI